ncbi:DNA polymerase IV [Arcanobacterium haemolyticum]|nr:DNA polymerase IV [Arcanobacterium haemolyticum]
MSKAPRSAAAKRSWGDDDSATPILHVDMDAFFVSVELLDRPDLRGKPVAVGGKERGVVSAASYEARAYGVNSAMPVGKAYRLCPQLIMLPPRMARYSEASRKIMAILGEVTPLIEQVSVDEAFLDVSGAVKLFGSPVTIAHMIRRRIRAEVGVPASVGIAATKHVAKIASAHAKPDGLLLIPESATQEFLDGLPVGALWGVGDRARERLNVQGVETVGDLVATGRERLVKLFGSATGNHLYDLATGIDRRPVATTRIEKSIGREETFFDHVSDRAELEKVLLAQCHDTARRLRAKGFVARSVAIKVRFADFTTITRSATLAQATNVASELYEAVRELLSSVSIRGEGLRLLGMRADQLASPSDGIQLAFDDDPRRAQAEAVMDAVHSKFGRGALRPGSLVQVEPHNLVKGEGKPGATGARK